MKRFTFRLARLERLREAERRQARIALMHSLADARRIEAVAEAARRMLEESWSHERGAEAGEDIASWRALAEWREGRRRVVQQAVVDRRLAAEHVERAAGAHADASRAHRVLEKIREHRRAAWVAEYQSEEMKFLDEAHLQRRLRDERDRCAPVEEDR